MAEKYLVGIIKVPLSAFTFQPGVGREESHTIVKRLSNVFRRTRCRSQQWENHVKGLIDRDTFAAVLARLNCTEDQFRSTYTDASSRVCAWMGGFSVSTGGTGLPPRRGLLAKGSGGR